MKNILNIQGFKCWSNASVILNNISVLIGSNGAGKSSIIQSLLLLSQVYTIKSKNAEVVIPLHNIMGLDFGKLDNLIYDSGKIDDNTEAAKTIKLELDNFAVTIPIPEDDLEGHYIKLNAVDVPSKDFPLGQVHYLDAERLGPRYACEYKGDDIRGCGIHGENTAYMWQEHERDKVLPGKRLNGEVEGNFSIHLAEWIDYIFDGVKLHIKKLYDRAIQVQVANGNSDSTMLNIGFGVSYALPILVEGLLLNDGDTLIVENPEAHLHPKAQARMGYFLAVMAASGLRIVIETHSEHILKGIYTAIQSNINLSGDDVSVIMIEKEESQHVINEIEMTENIDEAKYPKGFFDVADSDILTPETKRLRGLI